MKNLYCFFFFLILCMLVSLPVQAKISIGITGGLNRSTLISDPEGLLHITDKDYFIIGAEGAYELDNHFSAGLSVLYFGKGCHFTIEGQDDVQATFDLEYIQLPVTVNYSLKLPFIIPYISVGFFYEHNVSAQLTYKGSDFINQSDVKDDVMDSNYGYLIGCGFKRKEGKLIFLIGASYSRGLQSLYDMDFNADSTLKTQGIQLFAGIKYLIL